MMPINLGHNALSLLMVVCTLISEILKYRINVHFRIDKISYQSIFIVNILSIYIIINLFMGEGTEREIKYLPKV